MPTYTASWDETAPAGTSALSSGDDAIRDFKRDVRERLNTDHWYPSTDDAARTGYHRQVTLPDSAAAPTAVALAGIAYSLLVSSNSELHWRNQAGTTVQLTAAGKLNLAALDDYTRSKTGDWMMSSVTTARTGWTNVSATYSNKFMRINATPLTTGGADTHDHGAVTGSTTLTSAQSGIPAHGHTVTNQRNANGWSSGDFFQGSNDSGPIQNLTVPNNSAADAASGHTHPISSVNNIPAFVQVVIFQKD